MIGMDSFALDISHPAYINPYVNCTFIPLSHSTDRIRVWETIINGGRSGFAFYNHAHWSEHETVKKELFVDQLSKQTNGVEVLFNDVRPLKPTFFVGPTRIWNGLYNIYLT
jgi:hypothetical protein